MGDRAEQHIDRRLVAIDQRAVLNFDHILRPAHLQGHVPAAGSDQCPPGDDAVTVLRLAHFDGTQAVQSFGKHGGELLGHVLDDDDTGAHGGQRGQHSLQCLGAAGGRTDGNDRVRRLVEPHRHDRFGGRGRVDGIQRGNGARCSDRAQARVRGGAYCADHVVGGVLQELLQAHLRLGDDADGAGGQGIQTGLRSCFGQCRADHHGRRPFGHHLAQEGQAIHARHLDVQHDHIGPVQLHALQRKYRIGHGSHDLDIRFGRQHTGRHLTHHRRVIDNEHFDLVHGLM